MITVAGFNTSLDTLLEVDSLTPGGVHRVREVHRYPGGKGIHVALTAAALGEPVRLVGIIDPLRRAGFESFLGARGVELHACAVEGEIRTCLAVRESGGRTTELLEPGPELNQVRRDELVGLFRALAAGSSLAVITGSVPRGFGDAVYAELVEALHRFGVRGIVDASGALMQSAAAAAPFMIKPNRDEAAELAGLPVAGVAEAGRAARELARRFGIPLVAISLADEGAVACAGGRLIHASAARVDSGNSVGSGDCFVGGAAVALARGADPEEMLRLAVACGAANAATPETGLVRRADVDAALSRVVTRSLD